jgi:outer membrane lipoprotein-sorting protein
MSYLKPFLLATLLAGSALSASAEKITLDKLSAYLNGIKSAKGGFTQINSDGTISTGTIFIKRPGRARFEYNPPDQALVMAGGGQLAIFDEKSNTPPEQYPLRRTPLSLILKKNVNLGAAEMVVAHTASENATTVVAQDPKHPDYGQIRLLFTDDPVELRQWVIVDGNGGETTVILGGLERGLDLASSLFSITLEAQERGF